MILGRQRWERMKVDMYAHRLETLARKKFGDESINECKPLMKKFLDTVPPYVAECVNVKRKEKMRWTNERLLWEDVLELIEDRVFDEFETRYENELNEVNMGKKHIPQMKSYRDALKADPFAVMMEFLNENYGQRGNVSKGQDNWNRVSSGRNGRNNFNLRNEREAQNVQVNCFRCGKEGHRVSECRWATGACFGCGRMGHLVSQCKDQRAECFICKQTGHFARNCPQNRGRGVGGQCGNCGQSGHFARMCKKDVSSCAKCGNMGHLTSFCRVRVGQNVSTNRNLAGGNERNVTESNNTQEQGGN